MFEYPERAKLQYIIESDIGYIIIKYDQACSSDTRDYFALLEKGDIIRISEYRKPIIDKTEYVITKHKRYIPFHKKRQKRKLKIYLKNHFFDYHNEIIQTLHKTRKSKYDDEDEPKQKAERKQLFQTSLEIVSKISKIPIDEIHTRLTIEQIGRLLDKARFDYYETFDAGQAINTNIRSKMGLSQEQKDLLSRIKQNKK